MGFKWFKARVRMNRTPAHTSAVAGSYRTMTFDEPNYEVRSNYNQRDNGNIEPEPKLSIRQQSMPALNNLNIEAANGDDDLVFVSSSNIETAFSSSTRNLYDLEINGADMYNGLGAGDPSVLRKSLLKPDVTANITQKTPRPVQKSQKGDYKRKKVKAPTPKTDFNKSSPSTSESNPARVLTLQDDRRMSQGSDIDV